MEGGGPRPSGVATARQVGTSPELARPDYCRRVWVFDRGRPQRAAVVTPGSWRGYVVTHPSGFGLIALYAAYMACVVRWEVRTKSGGTGSDVTSLSLKRRRWGKRG